MNNDILWAGNCHENGKQILTIINAWVDKKSRNVSQVRSCQTIYDVGFQLLKVVEEQIGTCSTIKDASPIKRAAAFCYAIAYVRPLRAQASHLMWSEHAINAALAWQCACLYLVKSTFPINGRNKCDHESPRFPSDHYCVDFIFHLVPDSNKTSALTTQSLCLLLESFFYNSNAEVAGSIQPKWDFSSHLGLPDLYKELGLLPVQ
jgi:hypothetical protein